jgi:hypothetical protein
MIRFGLIALTLAATATGCATGGGPYGATEALKLDRVVLYRNGIGYFERRGEVDGDILRIRCRKDQVNDILKSITVVDRSSGQAQSVSMPLDPQNWANAALSTLKPGQGNLAGILDSLRGTWVTLKTAKKSVKGRILMVESIAGNKGAKEQRISVVDDDLVQVVTLSEVTHVRFEDGELAMQLNRSLDATSAEGLFQQVMIEIRLTGSSSHDLQINYVVAAPIWKPTYRVVLPEKDGDALLQAWAVVDNVSGEDWKDVRMSLTSGTPIAFRFDLHTPRNVGRKDLSRFGAGRTAKVAHGEVSIGDLLSGHGRGGLGTISIGEGGSSKVGKVGMPRAKRKRARGRLRKAAAPIPDSLEYAEAEAEDGFMADDLARSVHAKTKAAQVSGLTRYDLQGRVTVPDGTSTMVAILNNQVKAEQAFLFRPGGAGAGYERNPYRVVRFTNNSPFVLETGPISIYSGGSFVGEGIAKTIAAGARTTIPFSVEQEIHVTSHAGWGTGDTRLVKMKGGVMTVERWQQYTTNWKVQTPKSDKKTKVLIRHTRRGNQFALKDKVEGLEEVAGAWLVPVYVEPGQTEAKIKLVEQSPRRTTVSIWDNSASQLLSTFIKAKNVDEATLNKLKPIIAKRQEIATIDREVANLKKQQRELDQRANQTRQNLEALKKDKAAGKLRARLSKRLDGFTKDGDKLGRRVIELTSQRLERKIEIDELVDGLSFQTK